MNDISWLEVVRETYPSPKIRRLAHEVEYLTGRGEHPSDEQLAKAVGVDRRTIIRHRYVLRRDGLLDWTKVNGSENTYVLKTPRSFDLKKLTCEHCDEPIRDARRSTRRFCSERCRQAAGRIRRGS